MVQLPPVIERELRTFGRKGWVFTIRSLLAMAAFLAVLSAESASASTNPGQGGFYFMLWVGFMLAQFCGAALTAPSLTDERHQGTLALLFITPLRPMQVLLAKLVGQLMLPFSLLLVMAPASGIMVLAGGVTGLDVLLSSMAMVNLAFWSLAVGLLVAALSREDGNPTVAAACFLLASAIASWVALAWQGAGDRPEAVRLVRWFLPGCGIPLSVKVQSADEWIDFLANISATQTEAWAMIGIAAWQCRRLVRGRVADHRANAWTRWLQWLRFGGRSRRGSLCRVLEQRPTEWLVRRNRSTSLNAWAVAASAIGGMGWAFTFDAGTQMTATWFFTWLCFNGIKLLAATSGIERARSERTSGALEMVLTTPLTLAELRVGFVRGLGLPLLMPYLTALGTAVGLCLLRGWSDGLVEGERLETAALLVLFGLCGAGEIFGVAIMGFAFGLLRPNRLVALFSTFGFGWALPGCIFAISLFSVFDEHWLIPFMVGGMFAFMAAAACWSIGQNHLNEALESLAKNPCELALPFREASEEESGGAAKPDGPPVPSTRD